MPKVVLITGCSAGGIGFALCQEFAKQGCKVYATARRPESMDTLTGPNIEKLMLDVTSDEDVQRVFSHIADKEQRIDVVVNNAGLSIMGPVIDLSLDDFKLAFETNVFSVVRICKAVIPVMAKNKSGVIVNIGSVMGEIPTPWVSTYAASKAALRGLTDVLWMECKALNISVINVSPGSIKSNFSNNSQALFSLPPDSLFTAYLPAIIRRIHASQGPNKITTEAFAQQVATAALKQNPPRYMTMGGHSFLFRILQWVPRSAALLFLWWIHSRR